MSTKDDHCADQFVAFVRTVAQLRDPESGCPWDLKQDFQSLRRYMLEEAYEAFDAMSRLHPAASDRALANSLKSELGDVLLQVVLNSQVAKDHGLFEIRDVIASINDKMIRRHPHVFSRDTAGRFLTEDQLRENWERIKLEEASSGTRIEAGGGIFSDVESHMFPATTQAANIGKRAGKINFDWESTGEVFEQLELEIAELKEQLDEGKSREAMLSELGDVYFTLAQVCRHLGEDPEVTARQGNIKFLDRFKIVEQIAEDEGIEVSNASRQVLESLWRRAKTLKD